jgi:hypothetical protein
VTLFAYPGSGRSVTAGLDCETLAKDRVYEFAFVAGPMKLRGASAAPFRPIALPIH